MARRLAVGLALMLVASAVHAQPNPATPPPPATAAAGPKPRPLLILRVNDQTIALRARAAKVDANQVLVETLDGAAQTLDRGTYISQLPWYSDAELESGQVDVNNLVTRYRAFSEVYPDVKKTLLAEAKRFVDLTERARNAKAQQEASVKKRLADFLAVQYDPAKTYTHDEMAGFVHEADELPGLVPAQSARIAELAAPIREGLTKMDAGLAYYQGKWQPAANVQAMKKQQEETAVRLTFDKTLVLPLDSVVLSTSQVIQGLAMPSLPLLALAAFGLFLLRGARRTVGFSMIAVAVVAAIAGISLLTANNAGTLTFPSRESADTQAKSDRIVRLLHRASVSHSEPAAGADSLLRLTDADLSSFLARHVQPTDESAQAGGLRRDGLALGTTPDGLTVLEKVAAAGLTAYLRFDVKLDATGRVPGVKSYEVHAGRVPLPGSIKNLLWARLAPTLGAYIANHRLLEAFALNDLNRGEITLAAINPVKTPEPAPTLPASAPRITAAAPEPATANASAPERSASDPE